MTEEQKKQFLETLQRANDSLTKKDFETNFKLVLEVVKKAKDQMSEFVSFLKNEFSKIKQKNEETLDEIQNKVDAKLASVKDGRDGAKGEKGDPGRDADESKIIAEASKMAQESVKPLIPTIEQIEQDLPKLGLPIRDALELLQGEERLTAKAIEEKSLEEIIIDLIKKNAPQRTFGGGGFSAIAMEQHFLDPYTPTGDINGVNTDFTLSHTPSPATSLKVYKDGQKQKLTTDYTLSGVTVSFVTAPLTDSIIEVEHRI